MTDTHDADFQGSFFSLSIDGLTLGYFTGCSGISIDLDPVNFKQGDGKMIIERKRPGRPKYAEVELKRGLTASTSLYEWFDAIVTGKDKTPYKTATITVFDRAAAPIAKFRLDKCWPSKLSVSDLSASKDDVMIESLTMQHELLDWAP